MHKLGAKGHDYVLWAKRRLIGSTQTIDNPHTAIGSLAHRLADLSCCVSSLQCSQGLQPGVGCVWWEQKRGQGQASRTWQVGAHTLPRVSAGLAVWPTTHVVQLCEQQMLSCLQVIADFAADNCVYLELRTTPKV